MANYHVGCGVTGIFAGTLNKKGDMWVNKYMKSVDLSGKKRICLRWRWKNDR